MGDQSHMAVQANTVGSSLCISVCCIVCQLCTLYMESVTKLSFFGIGNESERTDQSPIKQAPDPLVITAADLQQTYSERL